MSEKRPRIKDMSRRDLLSEKRAIALELEAAAKQRDKLKSRLLAVKKKLEGVPERGVCIGACDHSLLRFIERELGFDVRAAEDQLIQRAIAGDPRCIVKDGLIVTFLGAEMNLVEEENGEDHPNG